MCTITINPALIVATPLQQGSDITVSGTVANCASGVIKVSVDCAGGAYTAFAQVSGNNWSAQIKSHCICGQPVVIQAVCQDPNPCSDSYSGLLNCSPACCPTVINNKHAMGTWTSSGKRLVTFDTKLNVPASCSVTVQRDFGDGTLGAVKTLPSGTTQYWETHPYSFGNYTSKLNIISPAGCGLYTDAVSNLTPAPPCATNSLWQTLCVMLENLYVLLMVTGTAIVLALWPLSCGAVGPTAYAAAVGMYASSVPVFAALYYSCSDCACPGGFPGFFTKLAGQIVLGLGVAILVFAIPCWGAFGPSAIFIGAGGGLILYGQWYAANEHICPLTICDYWQAYANAIYIALSAAAIIFTLTGALVIGLLIVILTAVAMLINAYVQINNHLVAGNC